MPNRCWPIRLTLFRSRCWRFPRAPCLIEGRAEPRHVDLRPFVLHGRETRIVPGAFCRVALRRGGIVVNSS